jgi:hypothetical protein
MSTLEDFEVSEIRKRLRNETGKEQQEQGDPDKKESGADPLPDTEQDEKRDDTGNMSEGAEAPEDNGDSNEREAAANMPDELTT